MMMNKIFIIIVNMSLSDRLLQVWKSANLIPPRVPLFYHDNQYMATIDDSSQLLRFMSVDGQIFVALNTNCQYGQPDPSIGQQVYMCTKVTPILCSPTHGPESFRDLFVMNNIVPYLI
jgi:hypothetical protein